MRIKVRNGGKINSIDSDSNLDAILNMPLTRHMRKVARPYAIKSQPQKPPLYFNCSKKNLDTEKIVEKAIEMGFTPAKSMELKRAMTLEHKHQLKDHGFCYAAQFWAVL